MLRLYRQVLHRGWLGPGRAMVEYQKTGMEAAQVTVASVKAIGNRASGLSNKIPKSKCAFLIMQLQRFTVHEHHYKADRTKSQRNLERQKNREYRYRALLLFFCP